MLDRVNALSVLQCLESEKAPIPRSVACVIQTSKRCRTVSRLIARALPGEWPMACALAGDKMIICVSSPVHCHWLKLYGPSILKKINEQLGSRYTLSVKTDPALLATGPERRPIQPFPKISTKTRALLIRTADYTDHAGLEEALAELAQSLPD